jgi:hypothetical protein
MYARMQLATRAARGTSVPRAARTTAPAGVGPSADEPTGVCIICVDASPPPIQTGCGCLGDSGLAHVECLVQRAVAQQPHRGNAAWRLCPTCAQDFTGAMRTALAEAWCSRVRGLAEESEDRSAAATNLAECSRSPATVHGKPLVAQRLQ